MKAIELLQTIEGLVDDVVEGRACLELTEGLKEWLHDWRRLTAQNEHYDQQAILVRLVKMEIESRMSEEAVRDAIAVLGPTAPEAARKLICATVVGELLNQLSIRLTPEEYTLLVSTETLMQRNAALSAENEKLRDELQSLQLTQYGE